MKKKLNKRICCFSDTHGLHNDVIIPKCDILIFAGDFDIHSLLDIERANKWFNKQPAIHKIFVAGNHDNYLEYIGKEKTKEFFNGITYLEDDLINIAGLRIYGSPYSPEFNGWSFMKPRGSEDLKNIWSKIPENLDILITHCPPYGILDRNLDDERCGCQVLQREIYKKRPKRHIHGHIHRFGGQSITQNGINFYNVSVLNEDYKIANEPTVIDI